MTKNDDGVAITVENPDGVGMTFTRPKRQKRVRRNLRAELDALQSRVDLAAKMIGWALDAGPGDGWPATYLKHALETLRGE